MPEVEAESEPDPFAETLKAFVLTSEEELRTFLEGLDLIRIRGDMRTLDKTDYSEELVLAAYYLWRPLKGDPLTLAGVALEGTKVEVLLELEQDPQGREAPYLLAPFYIAAIDKGPLPHGAPLDLVWRVNGEVAATLAVELD